MGRIRAAVTLLLLLVLGVNASNISTVSLTTVQQNPNSCLDSTAADDGSVGHEFVCNTTPTFTVTGGSVIYFAFSAAHNAASPQIKVNGSAAHVLGSLNGGGMPPNYLQGGAGHTYYPLVWDDVDSFWNLVGAVNLAVGGAGNLTTDTCVVLEQVSSGLLTCSSQLTDATVARRNFANNFTQQQTAPTFGTSTNCASPGGTCGSAASGSVTVAAAGTTVTVATTAVTASSVIVVTFDSSLGTKLSVTCNATEPALYGVTARSAGVSFQITSSSPITNPACFNYFIIN